MSAEKNRPSKEPNRQPTRPAPDAAPTLTRIHSGAVMSGICTGLAQRFGLPVFLWRLAFLVGALVFGFLLMVTFGRTMTATTLGARVVNGLGLVLCTAGTFAYFILRAVLRPDPAAPPKVDPFFRRIDWWTFGATTLLVFAGYYYTLAPDLTLEDSGELAVGSFYAAVPHPPGYPVWTLYTWLFTVLLPVSNIAWRVAVSSAVAGAFACGLIGLMASRGTSMILESIEAFRNLDRRWENALCMAAGYVSGMLIGFNGFMWSQSVIVEVYPLSLLSFMGVLCCLLRWVYAPTQRRYLYWAFFLFGVSFTNHQTLIVAAMGIEVLILLAYRPLGRDLLLLNSLVFLLGLVGRANGMLTALQENPLVFRIFVIVGLVSMAGCAWLTILEGKLGTELWTGICTGIFWFLGAAFYFYMPLTSMTNPPMNWGYPRTWEGFIHAFTRGQYERTNPTSDLGRFIDQLGVLFSGAVDEFNLVYLLIALVPFFFFARMQKREKGWMIGLSSLYLCLAVLLIVLLNTSPDRQSRDMNRVFFVASHVMISLWIGYGLAILGALLLTDYSTWRRFGLYGGAAAFAVALYAATVVFQTDRGSLFSSTALFGLEPSFDPLVRFTKLFSLALAAAVVVLFLVARTRPPLAALLALVAVMPATSILNHWAANEQRGHLFGYWFGHDMFRPPLHGTNNAALYPEMARNAVLFGGTDPGRFAPTYMIFNESFIPARCKPLDPTFDRRDVYLITQNALADGTYLNYIRAHYNRNTQVDPPFFQEMLRGRRDTQTGRTNVLARMLQPLDDFLLGFGARVEARRRKEGVYPEKEIYIPTGEDHGRSMNDYFLDAQRRLAVGQLKPGEDVRLDKNTGRLQVSGQVAVMAINALLAKVIFDHNPTNEFYVEESFPLDWMYPHLEPYGIIMKVNREPLAEMSPAIVEKDHTFWSQYADRLIGNWITYDTSVKEVCDFAVRVHEHHDYAGFTGDRKFIRDDQAQKSFSKLRSSIAGVYAWRFANQHNPAEQARMLKEADFAFRQAFAFCPYSPEAVLRYTTLLASVGRFEDALLIAETSLRFDPDNATIRGWARQIRDIQQGQGRLHEAEARLGELEHTLATNPADSRAAFDVASVYLMLQRTNDALRALDLLLAQSNPPPGTILSVANAFAQLGQGPRLEIALGRLTAITPSNPEVWYDLASTRAMIGKPTESLEALKRALELDTQRQSTDSSARRLREDLKTNSGFDSLRGLPEFRKLLSGG